MDSLKVFVSHSSTDAETARQLIDLLRAALSLGVADIRCTSVDGYRLPGGADTNSQLRREVNEALVLLGIISMKSLRSLYVVFELGARWGTGKPFVPLLAPGTTSGILSGPLSNINALRLDNEAQVQQLIHELATHLGRVPEPANAYHGHLQSFAAAMSTRQERAILADVDPGREENQRAEDGSLVDEPGRLSIPVGLRSHYFSSDTDSELCVLEDCSVLVCAAELSSMVELLPLLEQIARAERPLLIVARKVVGEALATLITNVQRGIIRACVVTTSDSPNAARIERLVATRTRGTIFHDEAWVPLDRAIIEQLGRASRVEVRRTTTVLSTGNT